MQNAGAVMSEGVLEQVGTIREVYEHPANVFVAGFIGSPAMSFATMGSTRAGDSLTLPRGELSVPSRAPTVRKRRLFRRGSAAPRRRQSATPT